MTIVQRLQADRAEARHKALDALGRYKFEMFGYWAAIWVHQNRLLAADGLGEPSPFRELVKKALELHEIPQEMAS